MPIELFAMERMQSTWENLVDFDMSESGVRPLTLRELIGMGLDLETFMDEPLGYSQSNGTPELRERIAALYPGASVEQIEVTNGTSEANYLIALSQLRPGDGVAMEVPNYMQMPGVARSLGASVRSFHLRQSNEWEPDWDEFDAAVTLPAWVEKPTSTASSPCCSRTSCPRFTWLRRRPISVARASPRCELCAHTTIFGGVPWRPRCCSSWPSVSCMCRSRRFHDDTSLRYIER